MRIRRVALRDRHMLVALAAGPLCWGMMTLAGVPRPVGRPPVDVLVYGVLISPLLEEFVFRGGLQVFLLRHAAMARKIAGLSTANVLTSVAFAAMHLWSQPPLWAASVFVPSLVFGHLRDRFDSILPAFVVHALYNAGFLLLFV